MLSSVRRRTRGKHYGRINIQQINHMQVSVFDTYVKKRDGNIMHFDIIVPTNTQVTSVYTYGAQYLKKKGQEGQEINSKQCQFCHVEHLQSYMEDDIKRHGYFILEMQGC